MSIYLLRHGFDTEEFKSGWSSVGLSDLGIDQIKTVGEYLKKSKLKIEHIVSSDLERAIETTQIISSFLECDIKYNPELREFNPGILSGMKYEEIAQHFPEFKVGKIDMNKNYPQGESPVQFYGRIRMCLQTLEDNTLYVTHRLVIEAIYHIVNGMEWNINNKRFSIEHGSLHEYNGGIIKKIIIKNRS